MENAKFKVGDTYQMRFITDSDLRVNFTCIKKTAKTATFKNSGSKEMLTKRIKFSDGDEYVLYDTYSMAPAINSRHKV